MSGTTCPGHRPLGCPFLGCPHIRQVGAFLGLFAVWAAASSSLCLIKASCSIPIKLTILCHLLYYLNKFYIIWMLNSYNHSILLVYYCIIISLRECNEINSKKNHLEHLLDIFLKSMYILSFFWCYFKLLAVINKPEIRCKFWLFCRTTIFLNHVRVE